MTGSFIFRTPNPVTAALGRPLRAASSAQTKGWKACTVIWRQTPKVESPNHWGSRIVFRPDGTLFVTTWATAINHAPLVQDLSTTIGKVVRINPDGSAPNDNPFVGKATQSPKSGRTAIATLRPRHCIRRQ